MGGTSLCPHPHQIEDWIQERVQQLEEPLPPGDLKDKLRHLRKHQAFKAEVQAHEDVMITVTKVSNNQALKLDSRMAKGKGLRWLGGGLRGQKSNISWCPLPPQEGEALLAQSHPWAAEVSQRLWALQAHWEKLGQAVALRGQDLEDMQNFLEFLQRVDLAEAWIQDMVRPSRAEAELGVAPCG